jgi:NCAIR mutase (PurE)-related protein
VGSVRDKADRKGLVAVVAAGTSDLPIAREAALSAEFLGSNVELICDVGIAGIHRLFKRLPDIRKARVVVAVAGMEGALAGVIAGQVSAPVIAVPTSVGYGAAFGGLSALLGMLTSCAPGISVVNIDNGCGAGYQANLINQGKLP